MGVNMKIEIEIRKELYNAINAIMYEMEYPRNYTFNDYVIDAIVEKANNEEELVFGLVDKYGFVNGRLLDDIREIIKTIHE